MAPGRYMMDAASMLGRVDENTIMVVPTLGVTDTGSYEPVQAMSAALDQLQADTGLDIDIHVDAASGGLLAPFCAPAVAFDFRLPRVKSISASGHKFGLAPLGVGWVVSGTAASSPATSSSRSITGRRQAGVPDQLRPGRPGRSSPATTTSSGSVTRATAASSRLLRHRPVPGRRDRQAGPFELLCDSNPNTGIPTVTWRTREGQNPGYTLFDLADRLRGRGWQVPAYTLT